VHVSTGSESRQTVIFNSTSKCQRKAVYGDPVSPILKSICRGFTWKSEFASRPAVAERAIVWFLARYVAQLDFLFAHFLVLQSFQIQQMRGTGESRYKKLRPKVEYPQSS